MKQAKAEKDCPDCGRTLPREEFSKAGKSSSGNWTYAKRCKQCFVTHRSQVHIERVVKAAAELGKKLECSVCGYNKCMSALDFHHLDPSTKEGGVGQMRGHSYQSIKDEISKCVVVCKNCHVEIHQGVFDFENDESD